MRRRDYDSNCFYSIIPDWHAPCIDGCITQLGWQKGSFHNVVLVQFDPRYRRSLCWRVPHRNVVRQCCRRPAADRLSSISQPKVIIMNGRFLLNRQQGKIMGIAAGLADYTGIDVLIIRLALIVGTLVTGPVLILLYILTGWLAADR